jgi:hypothetical protein
MAEVWALRTGLQEEGEEMPEVDDIPGGLRAKATPRGARRVSLEPSSDEAPGAERLEPVGADRGPPLLVVYLLTIATGATLGARVEG